MRDYKITIGYNLTGQDFFDMIMFYKKYIEEYYFSLTHTMEVKPLDLNFVYDGIKNSNQHGISANLLLNVPDECKQYKYLIEKAKECCEKVHAVSVYDLETAVKVKNDYPDLKVHISTHGSRFLDLDKLNSDIVYCVNLNEPYYHTDHHQNLIKVCQEKGIKLKYVVNRPCIFLKEKVLSKIANREIKCCNKECLPLGNKYPWLNLMRSSLYKESLDYVPIDFVKISSRQRNNKQVKDLLKYWTTKDKRTTNVYGIEINNNNYDVFLDWMKYKWTKCNGDCLNCDVCKKYYNKLVE